MLTEREAEERAKYRLTAEAIEAFLTQLGDHRPPKKKPADTSGSPLSEARSVRGARLLINDAQDAESLREWLPGALVAIEEWSEAQNAQAVFKQMDPEGLMDPLYKTVHTRTNELRETCAEIVWRKTERRPMTDRIEALEDLRRLYILAAGEDEAAQ